MRFSRVVSRKITPQTPLTQNLYTKCQPSPMLHSSLLDVSSSSVNASAPRIGMCALVLVIWTCLPCSAPVTAWSRGTQRCARCKAPTRPCGRPWTGQRPCGSCAFDRRPFSACGARLGRWVEREGVSPVVERVGDAAICMQLYTCKAHDSC